MKPLLVETVTGQTMAELCTARDAVRFADMVELRLDGVADVSVGQALEGRRHPVVVTCRPKWEEGRFEGSEEERRALLLEALDRGAEYVDVEWRAPFVNELVGAHGARVVISSHDFEGVPADLEERTRAMRATGAAIVKVAVTANRLCDALALKPLTRPGRTVVIAMGASGIPARLLPAHFGSCWTYGGDGHAPGQIQASRMVEEFRLREISRSTAVYGVVGTMTADSKSPGMHNGWFSQAGIDAVHIPLQAPSFDDFLAFAEALPVVGASVTIPFKLDALRHAVRADTSANMVGAANTLRRCPDGWEATNTDVAGFLAPLAGENLRGARVTILGAGGAARAIVVALLSVGAKPTVCARRGEQAREAASLGANIGTWPPEPGSWDMLVNCTPVGGVRNPDESPLPGGPFGGRMVYDLLYRPAESRLLRDARAAGCATIDGLPMLRAQAKKQFEWWTTSVCA